jgi:hypothetical protein
MTSDSSVPLAPGLVAIALLLSGSPAAAQLWRTSSHGLPRWADSALIQAGLGHRFELSSHLNPEAEFGDLDGDGFLDFVVKVVDGAGRRVLAIVHRGDGSVHLLGAGRLPIMGGWGVSSPRHRTRHGFFVPTGRDILYVAKPGTPTAWAIWDGRSYTWIQDEN